MRQATVNGDLFYRESRVAQRTARSNSQLLVTATWNSTTEEFDVTVDDEAVVLPDDCGFETPEDVRDFVDAELDKLLPVDMMGNASGEAIEAVIFWSKHPYDESTLDWKDANTMDYPRWGDTYTSSTFVEWDGEPETIENFWDEA